MFSPSAIKRARRVTRKAKQIDRDIPHSYWVDQSSRACLSRNIFAYEYQASNITAIRPGPRGWEPFFEPTRPHRSAFCVPEHREHNLDPRVRSGHILISRGTAEGDINDVSACDNMSLSYHKSNSSR